MFFPKPVSFSGSSCLLNKGKETFLKDVEDCCKEEGQSEEDEQFVGQFPPVVLQDQFPPQVNGSCHIFKFFICFQHSPGGGGCNEADEEGTLQRNYNFCTQAH